MDGKLLNPDEIGKNETAFHDFQRKKQNNEDTDENTLEIDMHCHRSTSKTNRWLYRIGDTEKQHKPLILYSQTLSYVTTGTMLYVW